jgi:septum formation protein
MDKAGAYGIQGLGAMLVESICGDYFTVMGLPLCRVAQRLRDYGIDPLCRKSGTETAEANDELQVMV